eukprot:SAG11_NODE_1328_length_5192_cov_17.527783_2_plen_116_part_00
MIDCQQRFCKMYGSDYGVDGNGNYGKGVPAWKNVPLFAKFAKGVFSIMISSAVVESLFSKYGYARSKARASIQDGTASSILYTQELEAMLDNVHLPFGALLALRDTSLTDRLDWV